jgi:uncharacterized DUF497 family protein
MLHSRKERMNLKFEWDEVKAIANLRKHKGVSFDEYEES